MDTNTPQPSHNLTDEIIEQLKQPMEQARVKLRKAQGGGVVPYISGEDAINTANRIFNFAWSSQVGEMRFIRTEERVEGHWNAETQKREATGVPALSSAGIGRKSMGLYYVPVSVTACGITKADVGRCICEGNSAEAHDMAIAGAVTDGLKRALRQFGDQFGNALYDRDSETFKEALQGQTPAWQQHNPEVGRRTPPARTPAAPNRPTFGRPIEQLIKGKDVNANHATDENQS